MSTRESTPAVVVGIDGSRAAVQAALWAVDEAADRNVPLRLVYVVDLSKLSGGVEQRQATARTALYDAFRAVEATGKRVTVETDVLWGKPLNKLMEESRSAAMICVGSMGLNHARSGQGSVAGTLAGSSLCPVAVINRSPDAADAARTPRVQRVVAEVDNGAVLRHAFRQARLRGVPLRAVCVQAAPALVAAGGESRTEPTKLDRRLSRWTRLYPDVPVEQAVVRGHPYRYLADCATPNQLLVTDSHTAQVCSVYNAGSSVLTVRCGNL
ncbi:universal stress protein [Mycobacterium asiaticum]|uniref:Universal stress protein n=1 Tax=Mycobacterium asiaticum TaxID=1790 RepID=A0A1A3P903_MYCAS|nr:universal stress protein [Mycobacterium asiaticum]OBK30641.1 universal stress protein [Mycobacterium asiaticum]